MPAELHGSVHIGMQATVVAGEPVGGAHSATIEVIDPLIDARRERSASAWCCQIRNMRIPAGLRCKIEFPVVSGSTEKQVPMHFQYPKASATRPPEHASRTIAPRYNGNHSIIGLKSAVILGGRNR